MMNQQAWVFCFSVLCAPLSQAADGAMPWFGAKQYLSCGPKIVQVDTSCSDQKKDLEFCFNQTVTFGDPDGESTKTYRIDHKVPVNEQDFIAKATCVKQDKDFYVVLTGTNFGNCHGCEWYDVFSNSGKYLGSTGGQYSDTSFKRRPFDKKLNMKKILDDAAETGRIAIYRAR